MLYSPAKVSIRTAGDRCSQVAGPAPSSSLPQDGHKAHRRISRRTTRQEERDGRPILVRYVWTGVTTQSPHLEQSFSADWGKTWETNWITDQTKEIP